MALEKSEGGMVHVESFEDMVLEEETTPHHGRRRSSREMSGHPFTHRRKQ